MIRSDYSNAFQKHSQTESARSSQSLPLEGWAGGEGMPGNLGAVASQVLEVLQCQTHSLVTRSLDSRISFLYMLGPFTTSTVAKTQVYYLTVLKVR